MSLTTIATGINDITGNYEPDYYAGRADAYDEHAAGTSLPVLLTRSDAITDWHPSNGYAAGYAYRVAEIRREESAIIDSQTGAAA